MNIIKYPEMLKKGGKIGVTSMSRGCEDENDFLKIDNAKRKFCELGIEVVTTPDINNCMKFVSTSANLRVEEFINLWKNNDVKAIVISHGGEFLMETIPYLEKYKNDLENINPKWVQGYSDVSLLNFYLTTNYNIATIHAENFSKYGMALWHESVKKPFEFLLSPGAFIQKNYTVYEIERNENASFDDSFNLTETVLYKNLYDEQAKDDKVSIKGRVLGGCIDVLRTILGTSFDNTLKFCKQFGEGMLWYIDICEMSVTELKRTLWQMKIAGWFDNANGFLIGRTRASTSIYDFTYLDALHDSFDDLNVPVIYDVDIGHVAPQWTLINGSMAEFEYQNGKGRIRQELI